MAEPSAIQAKRYAKKLNPTDIGDFGEIARRSEGNTDVTMLGVIMGEVRGLSYRANTQDPSQPSVALLGIFEGVPYDTKRDIIMSEICYLPGTVHNRLVEMVLGERKPPVTSSPKRGESVDIPGEKIEIAFEIGGKKSKVAGGAGYEFVTASIGNLAFDKIDLLAGLKSKIVKALPPREVRTITGVAATKMLEAPKPEASKARSRKR